MFEVSARRFHKQLTKHAARTHRKRCLESDDDDNVSTSEEESVDAQEDNLWNAGLMRSHSFAARRNHPRLLDQTTALFCHNKCLYLFPSIIYMVSLTLL